jgi:hypothetical protein
MASNGKKKYNYKKLQISGISEKTRDELNNISDHLGITMCALVKPALKTLIDSYPPHFKEPYEKD